MGADLCHQEHLFTAAVPECSAQDGLSLSVVVLPGVVEESNTGVYRLVNELNRLVQGRHIAEMMTTHTDSGNARIRASKFSIDHVARVLRRRCCSFPCCRRGDLLRVCQGAGHGSHSTRTDFKKGPSSRLHLCTSGRPA